MAGGSDGKAILDPEQMEAEVVVVRDKHCPPEEEAEVVRATARSVMHCKKHIAAFAAIKFQWPPIQFPFSSSSPT